MIALALIVAGFVALFAWVFYGFFSGMPQFRADIAAARDAGPRIMQSLESRPGAVLVGARTVNESIPITRNRGGIGWGQVFDAPGSFSETADWYVETLRSKGWASAQRDSRTAIFNKDRWVLRLDERYAPELPQPSCRYSVALRWSP